MRKDKHTIGTAAIQPEYKAQMQAVAEAIDEIFNGPKLPGLPQTRKVGFILLTFPFGETVAGRMNYMSNAKREDVKIALKEQIAYWDGAPDNQTENA